MLNGSRIKTLAPSHPRISVVMPVHNALPYLDRAMECILGQTFTNFEFVIFDDASTDGSTARLREWAETDSRIRLIGGEHNLGPALSSDRVARAARAPIIARMDADDLCDRNRLAAQFEVLQRHADVGVVGSLYEMIDAAGRKIRSIDRWRLLQHKACAPVAHGTLMYRREVFEAAGGYREECEFWEDLDLILRMTAISRMMVLPYSTYQNRLSPVSTRFASKEERVERALDRMYRARARLEHNLPYDEAPGSREVSGAKLDPRVFISLGSIKLWTGRRPHFFKRLLKRGNLGLNFPTASALVWTAWARLEPRSLRGFLRLLLRIRNLRASLAIRSDEPIEWLGGKGQVICAPVPQHDVYVLPAHRPSMSPAPAPQVTRRASSE
jgi:glycosyltransferase involved in cell wall biosynthesis